MADEKDDKALEKIRAKIEEDKARRAEAKKRGELARQRAIERQKRDKK